VFGWPVRLTGGEEDWEFAEGCQHQQGRYFCFPPYASPGGIGKLLFGHSELDSEGHFIFSHYPLEDLSDLGGSRCSAACCLKRVQKEIASMEDNGKAKSNNDARSVSSNISTTSSKLEQELPPAVLVYHESARSIVFRDHLRRQSVRKRAIATTGHQETGEEAAADSDDEEEDTKVVIVNFQPLIQPLKPLELGAADDFPPLLQSDPADPQVQQIMTKAEREVCHALQHEQALVKTIKNADWTAFLQRFHTPVLKTSGRWNDQHRDSPPSPQEGYPFNSFVTSTTLLPSSGKKMRCFGSTREYTTGVVFTLPKTYSNPQNNQNEDEAAAETETWSWPSGYSAKTEFNIDHRGRLINGRKEAIVELSGLRKLNHAYLHDPTFPFYNKMVSREQIAVLPFNEVYVRVGGVGRIVDNIDVGSQQPCPEASGRSLHHGIGLPTALFVRTATYGHLISLLRTRARISAVIGSQHIQNIPLLLITPECGTRVLTKPLQTQLLRVASQSLNPFQNVTIQHKTDINNNSPASLQQKLEELIDLDSDDIRETLTPEECARIAGGFGATKDSVEHLLMEIMEQDSKASSKEGGNDDSIPRMGHSRGKLQEIVTEGLEAAIRSADYNTSRQLLILYTLVASRGEKKKRQNLEGKQKQIPNNLIAGPSSGCKNGKVTSTKEVDAEEETSGYESDASRLSSESMKIVQELSFMNVNDNAGRKDDLNSRATTPPIAPLPPEEQRRNAEEAALLSQSYLPPPPPPPLDTDRLRSATNSDGLLAVLGAAQVLRAMQDGGAKKRAKEAMLSLEEWIENGEQSVAFRLASWRDQRAAQGDLQIAMQNDSNFMAFISNKAISNRKAFSSKLREAIESSDFGDVSFLRVIQTIISGLHSPCLRLELLQYILGLDNRYSVLHVARSVELAETCMNFSAYEMGVNSDSGGSEETSLPKLQGPS